MSTPESHEAAALKKSPIPHQPLTSKRLSGGKQILGWFIVITLIIATVVGSVAVSFQRNPVPPTANVFVSPHPDDEFQMWSLIQDRPHEYKIFVFLTRGEESRFCEPETFKKVFRGELGEIAPIPLPAGRWTEDCQEGRIDATIGYLADMSQADPTVPGDFEEPRNFEIPVEDGAPLPGGQQLCRMDGEDNQVCDASVRDVRVWLDSEDRGAVIFFNLGDGDLTVDNVELALRTLLDSREDWGLAPELEVGTLVGAFANDGSKWCFSYPHPDHLAVHEALRNIDFKVGPQMGATCFLDPNQKMSAFVNRKSTRASFNIDADGNRLGAHEQRYGWLHAETYPLSSILQNTLFQRFQSFWVRFN